MTSEEIFNRTVSLMGGEPKDRADFLPFWQDVLNLILAETFELNNALRSDRGKAQLSEIPYISYADEELEYEDIITRSLLPLGAAGYLLLEDEPQIASFFINKYENMKDLIFGADYCDSMALNAAD